MRRDSKLKLVRSAAIVVYRMHALPVATGVDVV